MYVEAVLVRLASVGEAENRLGGGLLRALSAWENVHYFLDRTANLFCSVPRSLWG